LKRKGFTLIELLVVIAIIAILAAILFPVFAKARATAKKAGCQSNLKQLGIAMQTYVQDWDEKYPIAYGSGDAFKKVYLDYPEKLYQYTGDWSVFRCPLQQDIYPGYHTINFLVNDMPIKVGTDMYLSFLCFARVGGTLGYHGFPGGVAVQDIQGTSQKIYLVENAWSHRTFPSYSPWKGNTNPWFFNADWFESNHWGGNNPATDTSYSPYTLDEEMDENKFVTARSDMEYVWDGTYYTSYNEDWRPHTGGANYLYCDGHVEFLRPGHKLFTDVSHVYDAMAVGRAAGTTGR
jgi:prepilin-type N-terminal cleavage/methylation domain-containing protein/prepilin-type processing-associated H-X9-DG protein